MTSASKIFRIPSTMKTEIVAHAVEAFLASAKNMEVPVPKK